MCKEAKEMLLGLEPQCDPDEVRYALEQTDAINTLLIKNGSPRFGGVEGVSQLTARAVHSPVWNNRSPVRSLRRMPWQTRHLTR
mgnify:CR=1 FL=1